MKRLFTLVLLLAVTSTALSQNFYGDCTVPKFSYVYGYAQPSGGGIEVGLWPQEDLVGGGLGIALSSSTSLNKTSNGTLSETRTNTLTMYTVGLLRVNRFLYPTVRLGVQDVSELYLGAGIRLSVPMQVGRTTSCAFIVEPLYTTQGLTGTGGLGLAF